MAINKNRVAIFGGIAVILAVALFFKLQTHPPEYYDYHFPRKFPVETRANKKIAYEACLANILYMQGEYAKINDSVIRVEMFLQNPKQHLYNLTLRVVTENDGINLIISNDSFEGKKDSEDMDSLWAHSINEAVRFVPR